MLPWLIVIFLLPLTDARFDIFEDVISKDFKEEKIWRRSAVDKLWGERRSMGHTPLVHMKIPGIPSVDFFMKNETASSSGTLKHRFAWSLFKWAVEGGMVTSNTTVYDTTAGNTGAGEAYMCRLIGVPYVAVDEKAAHIAQFGGNVMKVNVSDRLFFTAKLASDNGGFFIDQFANADAAEEYHESGDYGMESANVFHEIVAQLRANNSPLPDYFVHAAGTGGTISSVGKYITRYSLRTEVIMADSQFSQYYDYVRSNKQSMSANDTVTSAWVPPGIEGIGYGEIPRPIEFKNTSSLLRDVIDEAACVPDMATVAAMRSLRARNIDAGGSTAINFLVALYKGVQHERKKLGTRLSIAFIMGDPGQNYMSTYLNDSWVDTKMARLGGMKALHCWQRKIDQAIMHGTDFMEDASCDV